MIKRNFNRICKIAWLVITLPVSILMMIVLGILTLIWVIGKCGTVKEYWEICDGHSIIDAYKDVWYEIKYGKESREEA